MVFKITSDIGLKMAFAGREIPRAMIKRAPSPCFYQQICTRQKELKPQSDFSEKSNHYIESDMASSVLFGTCVQAF